MTHLKTCTLSSPFCSCQMQYQWNETPLKSQGDSRLQLNNYICRDPPSLSSVPPNRWRVHVCVLEFWRFAKPCLQHLGEQVKRIPTRHTSPDCILGYHWDRSWFHLLRHRVSSSNPGKEPTVCRYCPPGYWSAPLFQEIPNSISHLFRLVARLWDKNQIIYIYNLCI